MKDRQTKERFIALRGHGLPLANIAAEIAVSKTTLINWDPGLKEEIDNLGALQPEAVTTILPFDAQVGRIFRGYTQPDSAGSRRGICLSPQRKSEYSHVVTRREGAPQLRSRTLVVPTGNSARPAYLYYARCDRSMAVVLYPIVDVEPLCVQKAGNTVFE
jgi:hypothetical protein